jgi:uncharacterized YigZ family protein
MEQSDCYKTIQKRAEAEIKIKGSKFIGRTESIATAQDADEFLNSLRKKYYDATHHCFAYRVGIGNDCAFRYSDDGEPNGTAGRPIYDRLDGADLTNLIVVVTRYFGGTKLGTGGLTRAYSESAQKVIENAGIIEKFIYEKIAMIIPFPDYNNVERLIRKSGAKITDQDFAENVRLTADIRKSLAEKLKTDLIDLTSGRVKFE